MIRSLGDVAGTGPSYDHRQARPNPADGRLPWLATRLRRLAALAAHRHCSVALPPSVRLGPRFSLDIPGAGMFRVGGGCSFGSDFHCEINGSGRVVIGRGTSLGAMTLIQSSTTIEIGEECEIGPLTLLVDGQHLYGDHSRSFLEQGYTFRDVRIGDHARVGERCTIMASIGERAVVAPGSAVTRDIPPGAIARGIPAKVVAPVDPPGTPPTTGGQRADGRPVRR